MPRQTSQDSIHALTEDNVQLRSTLRSLLAENRANATLLIQPYKKGQNIETWLRQFEVAASSVGLNGVSRGIQVLKYLPDEASAWLMRTVDLTHWPTIVEKLASVYGVDPHVQKTICRRKLESLKQGTRRVAEYRMLFETVVADFPQGHELPDSVLRHIFFSNLRDELKAALLGIVAPEDTWKTLAVAAATRESALFLGNDHLLFEAPQSVVEPPFPMTAPAPEPAGPTPMELDAFTQRRSNKGDRRQHRPVSQRPSSDPMRRWARPGVPICGHCGIEGHLTKRCFKKQNRQAVHALQEQPLQDTNSDYPSNEPSSDDVICSLTYMTKPSVAYCGPRLSCRLLNTTVQALVDTGASISAIDSRLVTKLGLEPNTKASVNFTTADNRNTSSLGTVNVNAVLGELPVYLRCHVVENLSYPIIIGYSDLAALKAIIDTANNTISFPDSNDRYSTKEIPCRAAENLRLPGHHHAYLQVCGTPQALAFVSTPGNLAAEKLLSVAAGVVRFDAAGTATIKTANLSTNINFINKGQQIAFLEYLPSSPAVFDISSIKHNQDHHETETPSTSNPEPPMDFSSSISPSLPDLEKSQLTNLLSEFGDCFKSKPTTVTPRTQHHIDTGDHKPLSQPPHRASAAENDVISKLIDEMLQQGIVQPSNSPWSSPVVLVKKKDGTPRFCIDYRRLNNITTRDVYPLPRIDDTLHSLGNAKYFSTLDLTSSYWQIQLDQSSKPKSAFVCRRGLFEFVRMPFGLTNAPATMQRLMDSVLAGLKWQICLVYLDDIVVFSPSFDQHLKDVRSVLSRLRDAQLSANLKKCRFASQEISFLGYIISPAGLKTDPAKIRAVSDFPVPTNVEMLRSFLGLAGYYRSFISRFSAISAPLNSLLKRDTTWIWNDEHQSAYDTLKSALVSAPVLRFPDFERPFKLHTDGACTAGIGVMLCQRDPDNNRVYAVAFASRSLTPNERNYGVSEVEALAIVWGIKKFAHYLTGTKFTVVTDHQALQFFNSLSSDLRGRLARWSLYLQQHDYTIIYRPGKENSGPDALSRYPVTSPNLCSLTALDLRSSQADDPFCQELRAAPLPTGYSDESGVLFFGSRPVLPAALRNDMFELLHANPTTGHLGIGRTLQRFNRLFYFPNLRKWVQEKISACETCQRVKTVHKTLGHTKLAPSDPPVAPFDTIAMDTFGPLPHSTLGNRYVIVTQCMFSRYVIITPVPENNAINIIRTLNKIMAEHGVPRAILSDNGQPYASQLLKRWSEHLKIKQKYAPAYHPQSNGLVERFMETLRNMIVAFMNLEQNQYTWDEHLHEFQLAYNSSVHDSTKLSPFSVVHGREARLLATPDFGVRNIPVSDYFQKTKESLARVIEMVRLENTQSQARNALRYNEHRSVPQFQKDQLVLVDIPILSNAAAGRSSKLTKHFRGPFRIVNVLSADRFDLLEIATNKTWSNVHASKMKNYKKTNEDIVSSNAPDVANLNSFSNSGSGRVVATATTSYQMD